MDDDWQSTAFASRHMHNRVQSKPSRRNRSFDVHKTFGSYTCKCAAWHGKHDKNKNEEEVKLELYRLTPNGEGIIGEICFPGALVAAIVLSGSRANLNATIKEMEADTLEETEEIDGHGSDENGTSDVEDPLNDQKSDEELARIRNFEKNSFRVPKFWLRWNGTVEGSEAITSDLGYVVFSGADCRKFKGTITCEQLGWKDVAINGHKIAGRGASDVPIKWNERII